MKDMGDSNRGGIVYGFTTAGDTWWILSYDGASFQVSEEMDVIETMGNDKKRWVRDCSLLVDCVYAALENGGIVIVVWCGENASLWRHCVVEGEYLVEIFPGGFVCGR